MKTNVTVILFLLILGSGSLVWFYLNDVSAKPIGELTALEKGQIKPREDSLPDEIELESEGKTLKLPLADIPEYRDYVLHETDMQTELARTQFFTLDIPAIPETLHLLKYSCGSKQCSTILIKSDGTKNESLNMPTGIFQDYKLSPDHTKVLLRYAYDEGGQVHKQILVVIDLQSFTLIRYASPKLEEQFMLTPTWPVISTDWIDPNHFTVETAALETSEYNVLDKWFSSNDRKVKKIMIELDTSKRFNGYPRAE